MGQLVDHLPAIFQRCPKAARCGCALVYMIRPERQVEELKRVSVSRLRVAFCVSHEWDVAENLLLHNH